MSLALVSSLKFGNYFRVT